MTSHSNRSNHRGTVTSSKSNPTVQGLTRSPERRSNQKEGMKLVCPLENEPVSITAKFIESLKIVRKGF